MSRRAGLLQVHTVYHAPDFKPWYYSYFTLWHCSSWYACQNHPSEGPVPRKTVLQLLPVTTSSPKT